MSKQVSVQTSTATKGACGATLGPAAAPGPKLAPTGQQDVCPVSQVDKPTQELQGHTVRGLGGIAPKCSSKAYGLL